jgi:hypothetical protein
MVSYISGDVPQAGLRRCAFGVAGALSFNEPYLVQWYEKGHRYHAVGQCPCGEDCPYCVL